MDRTTPRDLYDLWYLLEIDGLRIEDYIYAFQEKAIFKGLMPSAFVEKVILKRNSLKSQWASYLSHQMRELPGLRERMQGFWKAFAKVLEIYRREQSRGRMYGIWECRCYLKLFNPLI